MEQVRVYIANLGRYDEGELVGAWLTPPIDFDEIEERIGLNNEYEEYVIHDYELPFKIDEYTPIEETNRLCGLAKELGGTPIGEVASEIQHTFFNSFERMVEHLDNIVYYPDCNDMSSLAYYLIEETGALGEVPTHLRNYIDCEVYGRDLEIERSCLVTSREVFELCE